MCGIIGYIGFRNAKEVCVDCLKRLEYRGYDSVGISIIDKQQQVYKEVGEIKQFEKTLPQINGNIGIGHNRWATHGAVTKENAHPHLSTNKKIAVVHNGI
ncbi:MAG: glutamine--fructose-6-phosphate aminotransferase, partial [Candidatus Thermoplasmatota archaeon]|nr:glutamine--fructose-6-phosphate aminotransferase [Candidatus Thermoplasmatota archaeon]